MPELHPKDIDLSVTLGGLRLANPILPASGTYAYGEEMGRFMDVRRLGGLLGKTITPQPRKGNPVPRMAETAAGMLNSIGLENPGIDVFCERVVHEMATRHDVVIANVAGDTWDSYAELAARVEQTGKVKAIELNLSCPNVAVGGVEFGTDPKAVEEIVRRVKKACGLHIMAKLTPNTHDITGLARAAENGGADSISLINTLIGMAVDWKARRPVIYRTTGGLSGPAIKPVALAMVYKCSKAVKTPLVGIGGISTTDDVLDFIVAGASAVQLGTINFVYPDRAETVLTELPAQLAAQGIARVRDLIGTLQPWS